MTSPTAARFETHEILNQSEPMEDYNAFAQDAALVEGLRREGGAWGEDDARAFGALTASRRVIELGHLANAFPPVLRTHDRFGRRVDEVEFHPAYHELMAIGAEAQIHSLPWNDDRRGAHAVRAAKHYLLTQTEAGVGCPLTMTFAAIPALRMQPELMREWGPRLQAPRYDPRFIPSERKNGAQMGMAMTEKQGGSDVRANTTRAEPIGAGGPGGEYRLTGHKWFCSAPMCDAFLTLAQAPGGLSCFLVPRWLPDGTRNRFAIQRLKEKLGNKSNASSEIEYQDTWARMVGGEGRGVPTIIEMVQHTRLDCVIGSAALMRQAAARALWHASRRSAFGRVLREQPLMRNVLADLALESEAATVLMMRLARAYDDAAEDPGARAFARVATAVSKYWVSKRCPELVGEALECHGGNGYAEESMMPRLYREAPLSSIWEGSGNVMCLDVLRALGKEPDAAPAFLGELEASRGADRRLDAAIDKIKDELSDSRDLQIRARRLTERMAQALQAALLLRHAPAAVADAYCASRLAGDHGSVYGTLPSGVDFGAIIDRATPKRD